MTARTAYESAPSVPMQLAIEQAKDGDPTRIIQWAEYLRQQRNIYEGKYFTALAEVARLKNGMAELKRVMREEQEEHRAEVRDLRGKVADLDQRLAKASETLRQMTGSDARLAGKREGVELARDYLRDLPSVGRTEPEGAGA